MFFKIHSDMSKKNSMELKELPKPIYVIKLTTEQFIH